MKPEPRVEEFPVGLLRFDPENPRMPASVSGKNEEEVIDWMLGDASIIELMGSIGEMGYFPGEPLLVVPLPKKPLHQVVEGNRRLCAVKLLANPKLAQRLKNTVGTISKEAVNKPHSLPIIVYSDRQEILTYLGYRHVTGIKSWGPLSKAKYLKQLYGASRQRNVQEKLRELAKIIGSKSNYVERLLKGLYVYDRILKQDYFDLEGVQDNLRFEVLNTALSYSNISSFLGVSRRGVAPKTLKQGELKDLTSWLFEKHGEERARVSESRRLKDLNEVVANPNALAAFRNGQPLDDAYRLTKAPADIFRASVIEARSLLKRAGNNIHWVSSPMPSDIDAVEDIQRIARNLLAILDKLLKDPEIGEP